MKEDSLNKELIIQEKKLFKSSYKGPILTICLSFLVRLFVWNIFSSIFIIPKNVSTSKLSNERYWFPTEIILAVSTRSNSFESIKEALFLSKLQKQLPKSLHPLKTSQPVSYYMNDISTIPPIILRMFELLGCDESNFILFIILLSCDVLVALFFARATIEVQRSAFRGRSDLILHIQRDTVQNNSKGHDMIDNVNANSINNNLEKNENTISKFRYSAKLISFNDYINPSIIIAIYLLNPVHVISGCLLSLSSLKTLFLIGSISLSVAPINNSFCNYFGAPLFLSFLLYILPLPNVIALAISLGHASYMRRKYHPYHVLSDNLKILNALDYFYIPSGFKYILAVLFKGIIPFLLVSFLGLIGLHNISFFLSDNSWNYWESCVTTLLLVKDLTPNFGLFWYVLQLVDLRFRLLYICAYQSLGMILVFPIILKYIKLPLTSIQIIASIVLLFQPHPNATDIMVLLCILLLDLSVVKHTPTFCLLVFGIFFGMLLFPVMSCLWLRRNTGNPNFLYTSQMICITCSSILIIHYAKASLRYHTGQDNAVQETLAQNH